MALRVQYRRGGRLGSKKAALLFAVSTAACGAADEMPAEEPLSLQAVLSIERIEDASRTETPSASAMAEFVLLPADADAHATLEAAGLRSGLPERIGCTEYNVADGGSRERGSPEPSRGVGVPEQLELLEAGDVSIHADGMVTRLALNLFPPSGRAGGVIYTTPDQSAEPLPADAVYAISASGSELIPPLDIQSRAPTALRDVALGGTSFERTSTIASGRSLELTWAEGEASDHVYVELTDGQNAVACMFADEDGAGTVPGALTSRFAQDSSVRVSVHRVREALRAQEPQRPGLSVLETMVRFDFEVTAVLRAE